MANEQPQSEYPPINIWREETYLRLRMIPPEIVELMHDSPIAGAVMQRFINSDLMYVEALELLARCLADQLRTMTAHCLKTYVDEAGFDL